MPAETLDGEALRQAVIFAAGDAGGGAMLAAAEVTAVATGVRWEASHGAVQGVEVTLALDAEELARLDASPAARDLLERGFAVAVAASQGHAMTALHTRWSRRGVVHGESYRHAAQTFVPVALDEALRRYCWARGEGVAVASALRCEEVAGGVTVSGSASIDRRNRQPIEAALAALLGAACDVRWKVR